MDFHKAQCYFSSTIQITALLAYSQRLPKSRSWTHRPVAPNSDLLDIYELGVLASGALVPINMVLYLVAKHGRQSWYLTFLAAVTSILGTATLASWTRISFILRNSSVVLESSSMSSSARCLGATNAIGATPATWCGQSQEQFFSWDYFPWYQPWLWAAWTVSILTLLLCTINKLAEDFPRMSPLMRILSKVNGRKPVRLLINITWLACFAGQLYLFSSFYQSSLISSTWSFGQIIAITVWIPSVVEFAYMEYCEKSPSQLSLINLRR